MKKIFLLRNRRPHGLLVLFICTLIFLGNYAGTCKSTNPSTGISQFQDKRHLKVPKDFPTIAKAIESANPGDWVIISPGTYFENEIIVNKPITISSEWKITGEKSKVDQTIVDISDKKLFIITSNDVEVSGLKLINGNHTLEISAGGVKVLNNHFVNNLDGISFETGSGGYVAYNLAENDRDDAIDSDIGEKSNNIGSYIIVEFNTLVNCNDDGIEIRLFKHPNQNINYTIRNNRIQGSKNTGIQLISYDVYTGKNFFIHHNIFQGCKTGLGCMEGANTKEDLTGASKMDEKVFFYNNTMVGNKMGATGGNNIVAMNNVVMGNELGGFKRFGKNSAIINNLFYQNGGEDFIEINDAVVKSGNLFAKDPLLDKNTFSPSENSPCVNAGKSKYHLTGTNHLEITSEYIVGSAPDIGAIEFGRVDTKSSVKKTLIVDAGEDMVMVSPKSKVVLKGKILDNADKPFKSYWKLEKGPGKVEILNPEKMESKIIFHQEGIYQFSLTCTEDKIKSSDNITIRYINDGDGKDLFLNDKDNNIIEAENFSYIYGQVEVMNDLNAPGNKFILLGDDVKKNINSIAEFSIGMAESSEYEMWFLVKSQTAGEKKLRIEFNAKVVGEVTVPTSNDFHWVKMIGKMVATPGQWQLLINDFEGKVLLDKILITKDKNLIPR